MKTRSTLYHQGVLHMLIFIGLLGMSLSPVVHAQAQEAAVPPPLSDQLTWQEVGEGERSFDVNGESATLSGVVYKAFEEFNLETSEDVAAYYSSTGMAQLGWELIYSEALPNGNISLYYQSGVFTRVEIVGCESNYTLSCLTVWVSHPTQIIPQPEAQGSNPLPATGTLKKSQPANNSTISSTSTTLSWTSFTGQNLNHYRYCIDTSDNSDCNSAQGWTSVWSGTSVDVSSLANGATYYWQVQAVLDDSTKVSADGGDWWHFQTPPPTPPAAFNKFLPASSTAGLPITPTLTWDASFNTTTYEYCLDTTNNNICDSNWISNGASRYITILSGVAANTTYYWQVRATNTYGTTYANTGTWFAFTTAAGPANDALAAAAELPALASEITLNTVAATMETGATSACSPGSGYTSVWYKYTATVARKLYLDTFGSSYDTYMAVWTKNANETLNAVSCNDDSASTKQSNLTLSATAGVVYYIQVAQVNPAAVPTTLPGGTLLLHLNTFQDVTGNNIFRKYIEKIYEKGITGGCATSPDMLYCPTSSVTRAQMAVFLLRSIHGASYTPPGVGASTGFSDVATNYWAAAWIKQLAAEGITGGCGAGIYCPDNTVTRDQMAVFLLKAKYGSSYTPPAVNGSTGFTDVAADYWAAAWIKQLAAEAITGGCGSSLYCPANLVTREQMAAFLQKTFGF